MKSCPTCQRNYFDETLAFCLEDGTVLSELHDPEETKFLSHPFDDEVLTRISHHDPRTTNRAQGMPTSNSMPPLTIMSEKGQPRRESNSISKLLIALTGVLIFFTGFSIVAFLVWKNVSETGSNSNVGFQNIDNGKVNAKNTNRNEKNSNIKSPTNVNSQIVDNNESGFGPWNYQASMNGENLTYYPATTPEKCQADCAKNPRCKGFTYIRAGAYNPNDSAMCYLAAKVTEMVSHKCCISAVKR